jgi:GH24 family phage-related lysozyme (muramidase)
MRGRLMSLADKYAARIREEEGFTPYSFWDDAPGGGKGQWTWGYGTVAPGEGCTCTEEQALKEVEVKIKQHLKDYEEVFDNQDITEAKMLALLDMMYNLGETRFRKFSKLIAAVKAYNWKEAGRQVRQSLYYRQVTNRAEENAQILEQEV